MLMDTLLEFPEDIANARMIEPSLEFQSDSDHHDVLCILEQPQIQEGTYQIGLVISSGRRNTAYFAQNVIVFNQAMISNPPHIVDIYDGPEMNWELVRINLAIDQENEGHYEHLQDEAETQVELQDGNMQRGEDNIINQEQFAIEKEHVRNRQRVDLDDCSICFESLSEGNLIKTNCNHYFHPECLPRTERFCALCRQRL